MNKTVNEGLLYIKDTLERSTSIDAMITLMITDALIRTLPDDIMTLQLED